MTLALQTSQLIRIAENSCAFREPTALAAGLHVSPDASAFGSLESAGISADLYKQYRYRLTRRRLTGGPRTSLRIIA